MMGEAWDKLNEEEQDQFILMLQDDGMGDDEVMSLMKTKYGLSESVAEACLDVRLPDGHGSLSKKPLIVSFQLSKIRVSSIMMQSKKQDLVKRTCTTQMHH